MSHPTYVSTSHTSPEPPSRSLAKFAKFPEPASWNIPWNIRTRFDNPNDSAHQLHQLRKPSPNSVILKEPKRLKNPVKLHADLRSSGFRTGCFSRSKLLQHDSEKGRATTPVQSGRQIPPLPLKQPSTPSASIAKTPAPARRKRPPAKQCIVCIINPPVPQPATIQGFPSSAIYIPIRHVSPHPRPVVNIVKTPTTSESAPPIPNTKGVPSSSPRPGTASPPRPPWGPQSKSRLAGTNGAGMPGQVATHLSTNRSTSKTHLRVSTQSLHSSQNPTPWNNPWNKPHRSRSNNRAHQAHQLRKLHLLTPKHRTQKSRKSRNPEILSQKPPILRTSIQIPARWDQRGGNTRPSCRPPHHQPLDLKNPPPRFHAEFA